MSEDVGSQEEKSEKRKGGKVIHLKLPPCFENMNNLGEQPQPIGLSQLFDMWHAMWGKKFIRVRGRLFYLGSKDLIEVESPSHLIAIMSQSGIIAWSEKANGAVTKLQFYDHLRLHSALPDYDHVAVAPQYPLTPRTYYHAAMTPNKLTGALDALLEYFNPATDCDRFLMKAYFLTMFWGNSAGQKPGFIFTGAEGTSHKGTRVGKTAFVTYTQELWAPGCLFQKSADDNRNPFTAGQLTASLVSNASYKIVCIDNIKAHKFSDQNIEGLLTSETITGKGAYSRTFSNTVPNEYLWTFTMNQVSMSSDMAGRLVTVKLKRPEAYDDWDERLRGYIRAARENIMNDILFLLRKPPVQLSSPFRFARWVREVLSHTASECPIETGELVDEIIRRGDSVDVDEEGLSDFEEFLEVKLRNFQFDHKRYEDDPSSMPNLRAEKECVLIVWQVFQRWVKEHFNLKKDPTPSFCLRQLRMNESGSILFGKHMFERHGVRHVLWRPTSETPSGCYVVPKEDNLAQVIVGRWTPLDWDHATAEYHRRSSQKR